MGHLRKMQSEKIPPPSYLPLILPSRTVVYSLGTSVQMSEGLLLLIESTPAQDKQLQATL